MNAPPPEADTPIKWGRWLFALLLIGLLFWNYRQQVAQDEATRAARVYGVRIYLIGQRWAGSKLYRDEAAAWRGEMGNALRVTVIGDETLRITGQLAGSDGIVSFIEGSLAPVLLPPPIQDPRTDGGRPAGSHMLNPCVRPAPPLERKSVDCASAKRK